LGDYRWDDIKDSRLADDACESNIDEENENQEEKAMRRDIPERWSHRRR
jgi:hypothetical protein